VWYRGRLAAIVDWSTARLGDPGEDVSQCRADLVVSHGLDVADTFLACYNAVAPQRLSDTWYTDAFMGLRALLNYERWLVGYHDAGLRHLESDDVRRRIEAFLERALAESASA
jgi:aminoglycoside phosphotransferase (APT) family kinase protein